MPGFLPNSGVTESIDTLVKDHTDKLMISKLRIFKYIALILRPFQLRFQTSKPIIPFLAVELDVTLRQLTSLVAKSKVVSDANTPYLLLQLDLGKNENLSNIDKVELGSAVTSALAKLKVKEEVKSKFRKDCAAIVLKSIEKIKERCPLKYPKKKSIRLKKEYLEFMNSVVVTAKEKLFSFDEDEDRFRQFWVV